MLDATERFLCIASYEKGQDFLRQCAAMGVRPTLLTLDNLREGDWPLDVLEGLSTMPSGLNREQILNTVSWMARGRRFDRIVALDEFNLETAAQIREHMRIPGMGTTTAGCYRDKLAMHVIASALGYLVPEFCRVLNYDEIRDFMQRVPAPWLLKPRSDTSGRPVRKIEDSEQLWRILDGLGDEQSHYLLEHFVPGDLFYVESIVSECEVKFQALYQFDAPIQPAMHEAGVFTSRAVDRESRDARELTAINRTLAPSLGMVRGVTHSNFIRAHADGRYYFLEIAARVADAFIADLVEVGTGVNLWREWARLEVCNLRGEAYTPPDFFETYTGSVRCVSHAAEPDIEGFKAPEIAVRMKKHNHAGLIVRSGSQGRVKELLDEYSAELARTLRGSLPPLGGMTPSA